MTKTNAVGVMPQFKLTSPYLTQPLPKKSEGWTFEEPKYPPTELGGWWMQLDPTSVFKKLLATPKTIKIIPTEEIKELKGARILNDEDLNNLVPIDEPTRK